MSSMKAEKLRGPVSSFGGSLYRDPCIGILQIPWKVLSQRSCEFLGSSDTPFTGNLRGIVSSFDGSLCRDPCTEILQIHWKVLSQRSCEFLQSSDIPFTGNLRGLVSSCDGSFNFLGRSFHRDLVSSPKAEKELHRDP